MNHGSPIFPTIYIYIFVVANIKILGIMLISQMIKGCKEKFFINQIYQTSSSGKKVFRQIMQLN